MINRYDVRGIDRVRQWLRRETRRETVVQLHGCGYGDDGPCSRPVTGDRVRDLRSKKATLLLETDRDDSR